MATCLFRSPLAPRLQAFWESRYSRSRGGISNQKILLYLDRFLMSELKSGKTITREAVVRWNESMAHLSPNTRINRLSVLRQFCRYLSYFEPRTCLIHVPVDPGAAVPGYSWWDVPVAEVSDEDAVRQARWWKEGLVAPGSVL